ncbi:ImmA/IrrE family metallo-endopeptidase [uncultured Roseobacter sp.]|uniref:ImmA/IrrE family metallo-endopeptidase n=1 Tax=uncultured Roseobacter sp. TaxID=114847 RepID=UPI0026189F0E|nr:ImmA/IrrE family metallo-endopeptidase [uncultured Roseobacter sp.]
MPAKRAPYPYVEPKATRKQRQEIEVVANQRARDWGFQIGAPLDAVCKKAGVDIEYSRRPNEILLEVPLEKRPVIWLPHAARKKDDRVTVTTALGHWALHVENTREEHQGCGIQALYKPDRSDALDEAQVFSLAFLMPSQEFVETWQQGSSQAVAERFDVPTKIAYLRAQSLELGDCS